MRLHPCSLWCMYVEDTFIQNEVLGEGGGVTWSAAEPVAFWSAVKCFISELYSSFSVYVATRMLRKSCPWPSSWLQPTSYWGETRQARAASSPGPDSWAWTCWSEWTHFTFILYPFSMRFKQCTSAANIKDSKCTVLTVLKWRYVGKELSQGTFCRYLEK